MTMTTTKPNNAKWSDSTGAKIEIVPNWGVADFLRTTAEDAMVHAKPGSVEYEDAVETLKQLWAQDVIECDHSYTELISVDDTRWLEPDGVHERSNPDETRCLVCGAIYNELEEEWQDQ